MIDEADDATESAEDTAPRADFSPKGAPKKKRGRPPKVRHDSPDDMPINGWGEPFEVSLAPGWRGFWASETDLSRMSHRPWTMATWFDPRVVAYQGAPRGDKGQPIKYRELTLMLMSESAAIALDKYDPRRKRHSQLRAALKSEALNSGDQHYRGRYREYEGQRQF